MAPVTSRLAQALVPGARRTTAVALAVVAAGAALGVACKPKGSAVPPCEEPQRVQILIRTSDRANVGENSQSWPTQVVVYQLSGTSVLEDLDADALKEQGEQALGDEFVDKKELTAFPSTKEGFEMQVKPKVTTLLVVAQFRVPLGTAWYTTYAVPAGLKDAQCDAAAKDADVPVPCVYLDIEGSELVGGAQPPSNFKAEEFGVVCGSVGAPKKKAKKKAPPKLPDTPQAPKDPTPKAPSSPSAPSQPSAPKVPGR